MTDTTTNPVDGEAMPEVATDPVIENDDLESIETTLEGDDDPDADSSDEEGDEEFEEVTRGEKTYRVPKALAGELMMQADYTRKTQETAELRKTVEARQAELQTQQQRQMEFAGEIAKLGALNARLQPYEQIQDWPTFLRTGGPEAQAHYAEFTALQRERDAFAQGLGQKVQERAAEEQRETAKQIEAGRAELAKHIKGYSPETLSKLESFAAPYGFSSDEIRQAEADPRSIRILHLAMVGQQVLQQQKRTSTIAQGSKTKPVSTLRGAGGRIAAKPDTNDFKAFERMAQERGMG